MQTIVTSLNSLNIVADGDLPPSGRIVDDQVSSWMFDYKIKNNEVYIYNPNLPHPPLCAYPGPSSHIFVPDTVNGMPVVYVEGVQHSASLLIGNPGFLLMGENLRSAVITVSPYP